MARPWWWGRDASAGLAAGAAFALFQPGASAQALFDPASYLVDVPTAGVTPHGTVATRGQVFPGGGVELRADLGLWDRGSVGVSYGGVQIIGDGRPEWYPRPGFAARVRVLEESWTFPALAVGIDTRGSGFWDETLNRYQFKSRGVFVALSKNYAFLGDLSLHGGASRSFEDDDDGTPTVFAGFEKSLGSRLGLALEYDLAMNDNRDDGVYGSGRGYLNALLRIRPAPQLELRLVVRDMLENSQFDDPGLSDVVVDDGWGREVSLTYCATAF